MKVRKTPLSDCYVLEPTVFEDDRGYFFESFNLRNFSESVGFKTDFVQDNQSRSSYGVLRGLHLQLGEFEQAKLVRCLEGKVLDVAVDLRRGSSTYKQHYSCILSEENKRQLFIPRGFAHGFSVLSEFATIHYKTDNYYNKESESGIRFDDPELSIDWQLPKSEIVISEKDDLLPSLSTFTQKTI